MTDGPASGQLYDVALSFAGEDRRYVQQVADHLKSHGVTVFYDAYAKVTLWGKNLYEHLTEVYSARSRYTVVFVSEHYAAKVWATVERRAAQSRALNETYEYILPVRFDDTPIAGLLPTTGYLDLRELEPADLGRLIIEKLAEHGRPRPDTSARSLRAEALVDRAARLQRKSADRQSLTEWLGSSAGVQAAGDEVRMLFTMLEQRALEIEARTRGGFVFRRRQDRLCVVGSQKHSVVVSWMLRYANTLNDSVLIVRTFAGFHSIEPGTEGQGPAMIAEYNYQFSRDADDLRGWRAFGGPVADFSMQPSQKLADSFLSELVDNTFD